MEAAMMTGVTRALDARRGAKQNRRARDELTVMERAMAGGGDARAIAERIVDEGWREEEDEEGAEKQRDEEEAEMQRNAEKQSKEEESEWQREQDDEDYEEDYGDDGEAEILADETSDFTKKLNALRTNTVGPNCQAAQNAFRAADTIEDRKRRRVKDRADRATCEQVLDPRTRLIVFRLLQREIITNIHGCISTGKEANVYHASDGTTSIAVKIYKTSILTFKDRERYVTGEYRYRNGYCKHNPRKMVSLWAEKEFRNLLRMHEAGLAVPRPLMLKGHVLLMQFIGRDGWPAPLLKNATLTQEEAERAFLSTARMMRRLYRECKLIHADLSEYNMLWMDGEVVLIDVSQSVEHDHPHSLQFLRSDCSNIIRFFRAAGAPVTSMRQLFELIVDPCISEQHAEKMLETRSHAPADDDALFAQVFIAHKLDHVLHFERDAALIQSGATTNNPYETIITKVQVVPEKGTEKKREESASEEEDEEENKEDEQESNSDSSEEGRKDNQPIKFVRPKEETAEERKERKKLVKDEQREARKSKTPKHVKKRKAQMNKKRDPFNEGMNRSIAGAGGGGAGGLVASGSRASPKPSSTQQRIEEVLRRKAEAERLVAARREALRQEQHAKLAKINNQRESERRERARKQHERELLRQKEALDRRQAQLDAQKAKKEAILAKAHAATSRLSATAKGKQPSFAFGSSTPRELAYITNITREQKQIDANRRLSKNNDSPSTTPTKAMSTSVYVPSPRSAAATAGTGTRASAAATRLSHTSRSSPMTQSLYVPAMSVTTTRSAPPPLPRQSRNASKAPATTARQTPKTPAAAPKPRVPSAVRAQKTKQAPPPRVATGAAATLLDAAPQEGDLEESDKRAEETGTPLLLLGSDAGTGGVSDAESADAGFSENGSYEKASSETTPTHQRLQPEEKVEERTPRAEAEKEVEESGVAELVYEEKKKRVEQEEVQEPHSEVEKEGVVEKKKKEQEQALLPEVVSADVEKEEESEKEEYPPAPAEESHELLPTYPSPPPEEPGAVSAAAIIPPEYNTHQRSLLDELVEVGAGSGLLPEAATAAAASPPPEVPALVPTMAEAVQPVAEPTPSPRQKEAAADTVPEPPYTERESAASEPVGLIDLSTTDRSMTSRSSVTSSPLPPPPAPQTVDSSEQLAYQPAQQQHQQATEEKSDGEAAASPAPAEEDSQKSSSSPPSTSPQQPKSAILDMVDAAAKEREERKARLAAILNRTRGAGTTNGTSSPEATAVTATQAATPALDASSVLERIARIKSNPRLLGSNTDLSASRDQLPGSVPSPPPGAAAAENNNQNNNQKKPDTFDPPASPNPPLLEM